MRHFIVSIRSLRRLDRRLAATACAALLALGGCGGGGSDGGPAAPTPPLTPATPNDVLVQNNSFNPRALTVSAGTTVKWTWATCTGGGGDPYGGGGGQTCVEHSLTWDAVGTPAVSQSEGTYQRTFATAGTYAYHCAIHGSAMTGTVVVQ